MLSPEHFQNSLSTFSIEGQWDDSLGFLRERFSTSTENDIDSRIIYRNDVITKLVKT